MDCGTGNVINTGDIFGGKYLLLISILNTIFVLNNIEQLNYTTTGISSTRFTPSELAF